MSIFDQSIRWYPLVSAGIRWYPLISACKFVPADKHIFIFFCLRIGIRWHFLHIRRRYLPADMLFFGLKITADSLSACYIHLRIA